ncbi:RNA polymerase sigma factor [Alteraurantiacibacter aquimixticola]|uniref:Sigma-70 family RNA polymerase sigma factor n=1 Tax=Alteraurantiacibacter aquimixticola TaxID=2489173 RepID=A0A4T3EYK6_9SPHN|nr:sigma-70 family RNA polymerase sigma factor [Alteraurantiacibacter aquimixticola]TIX49696.1 sigma-70 family RNA polymerase sigma factor [Alteraurantiacibacter aquimixticola]
MSTLERIISDYGQGLRRVAASYEADAMLQEDLFQEILLAIHQALPALREKERLAPYVYRIAHNRSVSHVAKAVGRKKGEASAADDVEEGQEPSPESAMIASERAHRLADAVRRLPLTYRQVVTLYLEEMPYAEIAEALDISPSNVGVRINRAKQMLKEMLA